MVTGEAVDIDQLAKARVRVGCHGLDPSRFCAAGKEQSAPTGSGSVILD